MKIDKTAYYMDERIYERKIVGKYDERLVDYWKRIVGKDYIIQSYQTEKFERYFGNIEYKEICLNKQWHLLEGIFLEKIECISPCEDEGTFNSFFELLVAAAETYFINETNEEILLYIWNVIDKQLFKERLIKIAIRTLIYEVQKCRENKKLKGKTPEQQYKNYVEEYLCNAEYLLQTYQMYPVLYREIFRCILLYTEYIKEFLRNFQKDFEIIRDQFEIEGNIQDLLKVVPLSSDVHKENKFPLYLEFTSGKKIVYKPRSLSNEVLFQKLEELFFKQCGIDYTPVKIIDCSDYGWGEFLQEKECCTVMEVEEYYLRYGILIFLTYLLGTKDIHYENIVACGNIPRLVDLEVLITLPKGICNGETANAVIQEKLGNSVLTSGMLPLFAWDTQGHGVNVSALNGKSGQILPIRVPKVKNKGRVDICIEYEYAKTQGGSNFVRYAGEIVNPIKYVDRISQGFFKAYDVLKVNRNKVIEILKKYMKGISNRHLIRDTQQYEMILSLSYHPDFLGDAAKREYLLMYLLSKNKKGISKKIIDSEVQALIRGDIPYFYVTTKNKQLLDGLKCIKKDFFDVTRLEQHIYDIDNSDIEFQQTLIYQSMEACQSEDGECLKEWDTKTYIDSIIQKIIKQAVYNKKYTDVSWLTTMNIEYGNRKLVMNAMDNYLYSGKMGIFIFLKAYLQSNNNCEIQRITDLLQNYFLGIQKKM